MALSTNSNSAGLSASRRSIDGSAGKLSVNLVPATSATPAATAIILHGYGDHSGRYLELQNWLAIRGVATVAFDFRGHGRSDGRRGFVCKWEDYLDDLRVVLDQSADWFAEGSADSAPAFIIAHSHGGLVLAAVAEEGILEGRIAGGIMSAPYLAPANQLTLPWRVFAKVANWLRPALRVKSGLSAEMMSSDPAMVADSRADPLLLRSATPRWYATAMQKQRQVLAHAADFKLPLLCFIGDQDEVASLDAARRFVETAGSSDKTFEVLPGIKHELLRELNREQTFEKILNWMLTSPPRSPRRIGEPGSIP